MQDREFRCEIELLPDVALQQIRVIRQVIQDLGRRQPIVAKLQAQVAHQSTSLCQIGGGLRCRSVNNADSMSAPNQEYFMNEIIPLAAFA
jgi:gamma-glutamylcysteine synthetase